MTKIIFQKNYDQRLNASRFILEVGWKVVHAIMKIVMALKEKGLTLLLPKVKQNQDSWNRVGAVL